MIPIQLVLFYRMEKYYAKKDVAASAQERRLDQKRPRIELDMNDIVADPGLRKPIDEFHHEIKKPIDVVLGVMVQVVLVQVV